MEHAVWLAALGALLALDNAMIGQFMIAQPLILGPIFGLMLGDVSAGLWAGAFIQLLWIGVLPVGAYIPADHTVTTGVTTAWTIYLLRQTPADFGTAMCYALCWAIPAGYLSGQLDIGVRHLNSYFTRRIEELSRDRGPECICRVNGLGLLPAWLRNFGIFWLWLGPLALLATRIFSQLPSPAVKGLGFAFWALPALFLAVMLDLVAKNRFHWWLIGVFAVVAVLVWAYPSWALALFAASAALGAGAASWRRAW